MSTENNPVRITQEMRKDAYRILLHSGSDPRELFISIKSRIARQLINAARLGKMFDAEYKAERELVEAVMIEINEEKESAE